MPVLNKVKLYPFHYLFMFLIDIDDTFKMNYYYGIAIDDILYDSLIHAYIVLFVSLYVDDRVLIA